MNINIVSELSNLKRSELFSDKAIKKLDVISSKLETIGDHPDINIRTNIYKVSNHIISIAEAIEDGHGDIDMMKALRDDLTVLEGSINSYKEDEKNEKKRLSSLLDSINKELSSAMAIKDRENSSGGVRLSPELKDLLTGSQTKDVGFDLETAAKVICGDNNGTLFDIHMMKTIEVASQRQKLLSKRLPTQKSAPHYAVLQLPLVVTSQLRLKSNKLDSIGIDSELFEDHIVLSDQMVLAVNNKYATQWDMSYYDMAEEIVKTLGTKSGVKLSIIHEGRPQRNCKGFYFFWIMPDQILTTFIKQSGAIYDWGLFI